VVMRDVRVVFPDGGNHVAFHANATPQGVWSH
jgi:hypothetical protein